MKISEYAVKNHQFTLIIFIMIIALGITTIINMPRSEDPELSAPEFPVIIVYPGTSPKDMEEMVIKPLEEKLSALEGIKKVTSEISDGLAILYVVYKHGNDVDEKFQEVIREINGIRSELLNDIRSIEVQKWLPSNVNIVQTALISENATNEKLKEYAKLLKEYLEQIPELKNVEIHGLPEKSIRVELKLDKMAAMNIPIDAVISYIQSESISIPGGSLNAGNKTYNIQTSGNYKSIEEIKNTIVASYNNNNVYLKDIAKVFSEFDNSKYITRMNGHRAVFVVAAQKPGENISEIQAEYLSVFNKFKSSLPVNIDFIHNFDQATNVNKRLGGLGLDFLIAILIVMITLLPLGNRPTIIVMISIPLSLSIGIVLMDLLGFTLNQLSIVGLVVALGLLVDDSIVVVENIERWMREGYSRFEATIKGTNQITLAVIGCTATLIIAFLPLVFLPGSSGDFIRSLPIGVITSVFASMLVSLTIIPFLASKILKEHSNNNEGNLFLRLLKKGIHKSYAKLLDKALKHPLQTTIIAVIIFGLSLALIPLIGFSLFPASEKPQFLIEIKTPLQSNIQYTDKITGKIENELSQVKDIKYFASNIGKGNPQVYYNVLPENERTDYAQIFVQLEEDTKAKRKLEIISYLRNKWSNFEGAKIEVKDFEQGPPIMAPVEVRILGENLDTLRNVASKIESVIQEVEGTIYVNNPVSNLKTDLKVVINKEKAAALGIPTINIDKTIRMAVAGLEIGKMTDDNGDNFTIVLTKEKSKMFSLEAFDNLYVNNLEGKAFPLSQIANIEMRASPITINHKNKIRTVSISAFVKKGFVNDKVIKDVVDKIENIKLPNGYRFEMGGEIESREESFGGFGSVIVVTLFLFIAVLILEFKTFKSTIIVLSVIPLGIVGAVIALLLTGNTLSFVAVIGLIALAGIEVKNTILLVDFTNQLREKGVTLEEAIREAGEVRFLPIILTSLTAIGGLLPIALSTNPMISPLAIVLIGGLISSTLLSRIITPVVYKLIPPKVG